MQYTKSGAACQKWKIINVFQDCYYILNLNEVENPKGQFLYADIIDNDTSGRIIGKHFEAEDDNFLWRIRPVNGGYHRIKAYNAPLYWDNRGYAEDYNLIELRSEDEPLENRYKQKFIIHPVEGNSSY